MTEFCRRPGMDRPADRLVQLLAEGFSTRDLRSFRSMVPNTRSVQVAQKVMVSISTPQVPIGVGLFPKGGDYLKLTVEPWKVTDGSWSMLWDSIGRYDTHQAKQAQDTRHNGGTGLINKVIQEGLRVADAMDSGEITLSSCPAPNDPLEAEIISVGLRMAARQKRGLGDGGIGRNLC